MELSRNELKKIADTSLLIGKSMLESGAEISIVESSLCNMVQSFGCEKVNLSVLPKTISMTLVSGNEFRTKMIHIESFSPDMQKLSELYRITKRVSSQSDPTDVLQETKKLLTHNQQFNASEKIFAAAFACAAFAALFQGSAIEVTAAFFAAFLAMSLKKILDGRGFNPLLTTTAASFLATVSVGAWISLGALEENKIALASSVLFLVPGVQLINTFEDIIKGHYLSGLARGLHGLMISFSIVFGIAVGLKLIGDSIV